MKNFLLISLTLATLVHAQEMSKQDKLRTCSNQILNTLIIDKVIGGDTGTCVDPVFDPETGGIISLTFSMSSDVFDLGKSDLKPETKQRLEKIKNFVLGYQQEVLDHNNPEASKVLTPDDLNFSIQSYADGVRGPVSMDEQIQQFKTWGELLEAISKDATSVNAARALLADANISSHQAVDFNALERRGSNLGRNLQSIFRNVFLGQTRAKSLCRELGVKQCEGRETLGFATPELEKKHTECAARRVSVITFNILSQADLNQSTKTEFHPNFKIAHDVFRGRTLAYDMQVASAMEIIKRQKQRQSPLPEKCGDEELRGTYLKLLDHFFTRYESFKAQVGSGHPLLKFFEKADYAAYRDAPVDAAFEKALSKFLDFKSTSKDLSFTTDYYNCFPSGKAIQYFMKYSSSNPYATVPGPSMLSNGFIKMSLNQNEIPTVTDRKGWMCEVCHKGINQQSDGSFTTNYRTQGLKGKNVELNAALHADSPTSFGSLKSPNVWIVNDCFNCNCLTGEKDLEQVLKSQGQRVTIGKLPWSPVYMVNRADLNDGSMSSEKGICLFTPPIAHACQFRPAGVSETQSPKSANESFSCMYRKLSKNKETQESVRTFTWTTDFAWQVLGLTPQELSANSQKSQMLEERVNSARCKVEELPSSSNVPASCQ